MRAEPNEPGVWCPHPRFPADPEFYRRTLDHLPTAVAVVDALGQIVYGNIALMQLGGWTHDEAGTNLVDHLHPADTAWVTEAFIELADSPGARVLGSSGPWAEVQTRLVAKDGTIVPVEVVATGGVLDPAVGGIIYEARPARSDNLLGRVLDGLSQGASLHHLLSVVCEMTAEPPLDMHSVVLEETADGSFTVIASTATPLAEAFGDATGLPEDKLPWSESTPVPTYADISMLPTPLGCSLVEAGYLDLWHVAVESPLATTRLRIIGCTSTSHLRSNAPLNRLTRARELAAAVLLRTRISDHTDRETARDPLTGLPSRPAFQQQTAAYYLHSPRSAIHLDLDDLRGVNHVYGWASGDAVLQIIADRLRALCGEDQLLARVGNDEFIVLLAGEGDVSSLSRQASGLASAIQDAIAEPIVVAGRSIGVTASIGIAMAGPGVKTDHLLSWADAAVRDAKQSGGSRICHRRPR